MPPNPIQSSPINRWIPIHVELCIFLTDFSILSNILPTALINSCHAPTWNTQHILYVIEDIHIYCQVLSFKWTDSLCQLTSVWLYCLPIRLDVFCVMCFIPKRLLLNNWVPYFNTFVIHKQKMLWFERISFKLVVMTHRSIHGTSPSYLQSYFTRVADMTFRRRLRSSTSHRLDVPPLQTAGGRFRFLVPPSGTTCLSTSHLRRHSRFSDNDSRPFRVTVQISSATRDLMFIQQNKFYWISNRSGVAELIQTVTPFCLPVPTKTQSLWLMCYYYHWSPLSGHLWPCCN